jgi:hypothetical protein
VFLAGLGEALAFAAGDWDSVAIQADGGVWRWGTWAGSPTPGPVPGLGLVANAWLSQDQDDDGLSAWGEWRYECDPYAADSNGDGIRDEAAVALGLSCGSLDTDGDGLLNTEEASAGTSLTSADTDGDGVGDAADCAPLDPTRSSCPVDPGDHTPPTITLLEPPNAILLP